MTVGEVMRELAKYDPEREVVLDVDRTLCRSDRNVLACDEVADYHPDPGYVFINASHEV